MKSYFIFLLFLCSALFSIAEEFCVGPGKKYPSIALALQDAAAGDTIRVFPGTYPGNLVLDKTIHLVGEGNPHILGEGKGSTILITADGCSIHGFLISHCGDMLQQEDAGILIKSSKNTIEKNALRDILFGIYFYNAHENTIRYNYIEGRQNLDLGERGSGLHLWDSMNNVLTDNEITQVRDGMYIQNSNNTEIKRNRVWKLRYGLHYMYSNANIFEENIFTDNMVGAAIMYSRNIRFSRNAFLHNRGFSSYGLLYQDCHNCVAEENLILDNSVGLFLESGSNNLFQRNVIAESDLAIHLFANAEKTVFTQNYFLHNLSPLKVIGKYTSTQWSHAGKGNYWSEYRGYDLDENGVGDHPYKIQSAFELLEGDFPALRLYLYSPAAQALEIAEKAFPIIEFSQERDPSPLMESPPVDMLLMSEKSAFSLWPRLAGVLFWIVFFLVCLGMIWQKNKVAYEE